MNPYLVSAYTITGLVLLVYGLHLGRERKALSARRKSNSS